MNGVTINELAWDYRHNTTGKDLKESCDIEVVPRKIVEMIIEKCREQMREYIARGENDYTDGKYDAGFSIKQYAESLLKQFEEDEKECADFSEWFTGKKED